MKKKLLFNTLQKYKIYKQFLKQKTAELLQNEFYKIPIPFLITIAASLIILQGGLFHPEGDYFLHNFLDDRPFLIKIFDAERHRDGAYQAREFSYLIDFIDAHVILWSAWFNITHFYSFTHILSSLIIVTLAFVTARKFFGQNSRAIGILIGLLFLTTPAIFLAPTYYRTSKMLVALFIALILYLLFHYYQGKKSHFKLIFWLPFLAFFMATSDKQGYFFVASFCAASALMILLFRSLRSIYVFLSFASVAGIYMYYSEKLAPRLIEHFSGKYPIFGAPYSMETTLGLITAYYEHAKTYFFYQFSFFFGNFGLPVGEFFAVILGILFLIVFVKNPLELIRNNDETVAKKVSLYIPLLLISTIPLVAVMLHYSLAFVTWPDIRIVYYNLPTLVLILFFTQLLVAKFLLRYPHLKKIVIAILLFFIASNIFSLREHYKTLTNGHLKIHYEASPHLKRCISERTVIETKFTPFLTQHADEACVLLRSKLGEHITATSVPSLQQQGKNQSCLFENVASIFLRYDFSNISNTYIPSSGILPDHPLYKLKVLRDKIALKSMCSPEKRLAFYLFQSNKQFAEVEALVEKKEIALAQTTALKAENNYTLLITEYAQHYLSGYQFNSKLTEAIHISALNHRALLKKILANVDKKDRLIFEQVVEFSTRNESRLKTLKKERERMIRIEKGKEKKKL